MTTVLPPDDASPSQNRRWPRLLRMTAWSLLSTLILLAVLLAVAAIAIGALRHGAPMQSVQGWVGAARPWVVVLQLAVIGAIWWYWEAIVKRARFAPAVEAAWLALRNRVLIWGLVLVGLGAYLWAVR